ncbi:YbbR domain-containing protein [Ruminiclostridium sufflavum DSM 19573]|uniref:YbbR domain-containing protein n=1 Tax=Ruminiclostridium sufflavum DSM 19573 TaxID=1121337 RepID=A0A318XJE9_9FIRM|nr:CdaR family protein [Ruminiclostridium sufflavum]PYG87330.1 YbbR domain-containing protein [Ruminiclostridium sufflavum DSM 19573]
MKEYLKKDLTYKILSIVFAVLLWFAVNPVKTGYYTVPINVINEESLKTYGLVLNTNTFSKYATVMVRERADILDAIKDEDFEVTLDLSKVKTVEDRVVALNAPVYMGRENLSENSIDIKVKTVELDLGKIEENPFVVQVETSGELASGYEIISKKADPDTVKIEALDSVIANVGSVKTYIDISGLDRDLQIQKKCRVYNKNGEEMPELSKDLSVTVSIEIGKRVPVVPITEGEPNKDFVEGTSTVNPESILLTEIDGKADTLSQVNEVSTVPISLENATQTFTKQALLQVPDGVKLVGSSREVSVTVEIIPLVEQSLLIPSKNITIIGKADDSSLNYELAESVTVKLKGKTEDLSKVKVTDLIPSIDVEGLEEGTHDVALAVILPNGVTQVEKVSVSVKISKAE